MSYTENELFDISNKLSVKNFKSIIKYFLILKASELTVEQAIEIQHECTDIIVKAADYKYQETRHDANIYSLVLSYAIQYITKYCKEKDLMKNLLGRVRKWYVPKKCFEEKLGNIEKITHITDFDYKV